MTLGCRERGSSGLESGLESLFFFLAAQRYVARVGDVNGVNGEWWVCCGRCRPMAAADVVPCRAVGIVWSVVYIVVCIV